MAVDQRKFILRFFYAVDDVKSNGLLMEHREDY